MFTRRRFIGSALTGGLGMLPVTGARSAETGFGPSDLPEGFIENAILDALPGKRPLIKKSFRPPNYETPVAYLNEMFTPNDAFFVRYHLPAIPRVDAADWTLRVGGEGAEKALVFTLADLKAQFEQVEIPALCLCSGNRRGLFKPHVAGVQWGYGAMGNARWRGVRLRDVLARAGMRKEALEIAFDGADTAPNEKAPDFVKSLPVGRALDESTIIAFEMNGEPLPHWNGFPARLVVPGWTATYWVKHLVAVTALTKPLDSFWMKTAYRVPKGKFPLVERFISQETEVNTPITEMVVNSLITNVQENQRFFVGTEVEVRGVAWDGGYGISAVEVSDNGGATWQDASLEKDYGRYSWRQWSHRFKPDAKGSRVVMVRASNRAGATQTPELIANPAGYHHNVVQRLTLYII